MSLEQRIYESRNSYYAALHESQREWRDGRHSIWPWTTYLARVIADAYDDFEQRLAKAGTTGETKQQRVRAHILQETPTVFRRRDLQRALPDVSPATIRLVLNELRDAGLIAVEVSGPGSRWRRTGEG